MYKKSSTLKLNNLEEKRKNRKKQNLIIAEADEQQKIYENITKIQREMNMEDIEFNL